MLDNGNTPPNGRCCSAIVCFLFSSMAWSGSPLYRLGLPPVYVTWQNVSLYEDSLGKCALVLVRAPYMHVSVASSSMSNRCPKGKPHYAASLLPALDLGGLNFVLAGAFVFLLLLPPSFSCDAHQLVTVVGQNTFWCSWTHT